MANSKEDEEPDYYAVLGVERDADLRRITKAFRFVVGDFNRYMFPS